MAAKAIYLTFACPNNLDTEICYSKCLFLIYELLFIKGCICGNSIIGEGIKEKAKIQTSKPMYMFNCWHLIRVK